MQKWEILENLRHAPAAGRDSNKTKVNIGIIILIRQVLVGSSEKCFACR